MLSVSVHYLKIINFKNNSKNKILNILLRKTKIGYLYTNREFIMKTFLEFQVKLEHASSAYDELDRRIDTLSNIPVETSF